MNTTAVIIIDMQNAFFAAGGSLDRRGDRIANAGELISRINDLVNFAHSHGMPVIFTRLVFDPNARSQSPLQKKMAESDRHLSYFAGAEDACLISSLTRADGDCVIDKAGYDPFHNTDLENLLRQQGVRRVVVAGVLTNICVESCVRSAFERGFEVIVIEDATDSYSASAKAASLGSMRRGFASVQSLNDFLRLAGDHAETASRTQPQKFAS